MKRNVRGWIAALCCAVMVVGCGDDIVTTDDAGPTDAGRDSSMPTDGGDECEGLTLCTTLGTSCDGDELVTCATNADGCRVEMRDDCAAADQVCNVTGDTASCIDPCLLIPTEMRCDAAGRTCDGTTLEICTANADGCFVLEATDCAAMPDGACGMGDTMLECLLPADPCAAIPAAERCTVEGTSCTGDDLVTCAPNAFGCLVTTTTDCTTRTGGSCDDTTDPAAATCVATDACAGITQCAAAYTECVGPTLVSCSADAFGCLVETTEDCTAAPFGFCDADATPSDMCSTAAIDPCMGVTECGTEASRSCSDRMTLSVCAANAFGCYVTEDTNCAATAGEVCDDTGTTPICVDACSLVDVCPAASYCDGTDIVSCTANADGCLVETTRTPCAAGELCDATGAAPVCATDTICPEAGPRVLDCASGTVSGDTAMGSDIGTGAGDCATTGYEGNEQYWRFRHTGTGPVEVQISSARGAATGDYDLFVLDGGDGTATCTTATLACLDESTNLNGDEDVVFAAAPGALAYVIYDNWTDNTSTTPYTLTVTCIDVVCGNGTVEGAETCDDGNVSAGDGCSATCAVEAGYTCTSAEPSVCALACGNGVTNTGETCDDGNTAAGDGCSATCTIESGYVCSGSPAVCVMTAPNATCAGGTAISATTTITGENSLSGGPRPQGTGCGTTTGNSALYYTVTIPAMTRVEVTTTTAVTFNRVLLVQDTCGATSCTFRTDTSPERATLRNDTASPITQIVAVHNYTASGSGLYDITFTYAPYVCGNGAIEGAEACDDGNVVGTDGCSATCTVESGYSCAGAPSVCVAQAANAVCSGATPLSGTTTLTGENLRAGGTPPSATGCGPSAGPVRYYAVAVPANSRVDLVADSTGTSWDLTLRTLDACGGVCTAHVDEWDTLDEELTFDNGTATARTVYVAVGSLSATVFDTYDLEITTTAYVCGNGTVDPGEACDDGNTAAGDGCSPTCTIAGGEVVAASGLPLAIPDNDTTGITSTVTVTSSCMVAAVRPTWSVTHTWSADVEMALVAPDGTRVVLTDDLGSSNNLVGPYMFVTGATPAWPGTGSPISAGTYGRDLTPFNGLPAAGTWTLEVRDDAAGDTGTLTGWTLAIDCI